VILCCGGAEVGHHSSCCLCLMFLHKISCSPCRPGAIPVGAQGSMRPIRAGARGAVRRRGQETGGSREYCCAPPKEFRFCGGIVRNFARAVAPWVSTTCPIYRTLEATVRPWRDGGEVAVL
jgi:hypothetical protein